MFEIDQEWTRCSSRLQDCLLQDYWALQSWQRTLALACYGLKDRGHGRAALRVHDGRGARLSVSDLLWSCSLLIPLTILLCSHSGPVLTPPPPPVSLPYWSPLLQSVASDMLSDRVCRSAHWSLCSSRLRWFQEEASLDNTESAPRFVQDRSFCPGQKVPPGSGYHGRVSQH